jgi:hypothetical protein
MVELIPGFHFQDAGARHTEYLPVAIGAIEALESL